jgi:hypothetical protein
MTKAESVGVVPRKIILESDVARAKQRARSLEGSTRNAGIRSKAKRIARQAKASQRRLQSLLNSALTPKMPCRSTRPSECLG